MEELRAEINGNVQGVGFRATTCTTAAQLGIKGIIRNRADGSVEIIAQGEREALKQLVEKLQSIFDVDFAVEFREPSQLYPDFSVSF